MLEIQQQIENHLDTVLGKVGLESSWRMELADHLRESYERCLEEKPTPEEAWKETLRRVGNLQSVSNELMELHNPSALEWILKTLSVGLGILAVFWLTRIRGLVFFDPIAALFVFIPTGLGLCFMKWPKATGFLSILGSRQVDWTVLRPYLRAGSIAGVFAGTALALGRFGNPSALGPALALAFLSGLYGLILAPFSGHLLLVMTLLIVLDWALLFSAFGWEGLGNPVFSKDFLLDPTVGVLLTLLAAWLYYGREECLRRSRQLPLIATLVTSILVLMNLSDPSRLVMLCLVAFLPMLTLYPIRGFVRVWKAN